MIRVLLACWLCAALLDAAQAPPDLGKPYKLNQLDGTAFALTLSAGKGARGEAPIKLGDGYLLEFHGSKLTMNGPDLPKPWSLAVDASGLTGDTVKFIAKCEAPNPKDRKQPALRLTLEASLGTDAKRISGTLSIAIKGADGKDQTTKLTIDGKPPEPAKK